MFYPAYVHKDRASAYGLTFPDFEGCFAAADTLEELQRAAKDAVEAHCVGERVALPMPSTPERWVGDERFQGGVWMLVDVASPQFSAS
jgi:predicted RNase H-like HicB family nuclease